MWPMVPMCACLSMLERQWLGLPRKSKYVTNSPSYPFVYAFLPSMVSCVVIFLCLFAMLVSTRCLQQNVKSWLNHPLIPLCGCILIGCSLMFSFSSIHLWCFFSLLLRQQLGPHPLIDGRAIHQLNKRAILHTLMLSFYHISNDTNAIFFCFLSSHVII